VIETDIKTPKQARAEVTVGHISEAATQLLDREQDPQFTTNHIAERSGFSIGTVYRYFPNKEAMRRTGSAISPKTIRTSFATPIRCAKTFVIYCL